MSGGVRVGGENRRRIRNEKIPRATSGAKTGAARGRGEQKISRALLFRTLFLLAVCGIVAFVILAVRLYDVQITNNSYFQSRTLSAQLRETSLAYSRGTIYDINGRILAMSGPVENVFISPLELELHEQDVRFIAEGLSYILGVDFGMVVERAGRSSSQYQIIKRRVEKAEADRVREFIREHSLRGVHFEPATQRYYPNDTLASHVIGFVGTENTGLDGIEHRLDAHLTGVSGRMIRLTNARGSELMFAGFGDYLRARDGNDITLTLNMSVQYYVEKHLAQAIIDFDVQGGAVAIAINPNTGEILAMANYPNFDPNNFLQLSEREMERLNYIEDEYEFIEEYRAAQFRQWRNQSIADSYEPGSVFKVLTYAMALEENVAQFDSVFHCTGMIEVQTPTGVSERRCPRRWGHGSQTLNESMYSSCNIACIELALRVGARTFYSYVDAFGLFDRTGFNNAVEGRSLWWDESVFFDRNNQTQIASASIGQTFQITPIQMITAASATINGGYLMEPFIISQITDSGGNIVEATEPTIVRQVISGETSAAMRTMLEGVVIHGTGRNAQVAGYRIGGKTGTSENILQLAARDEDDDSPKDYIVSFFGFAPADDPEIAILLLLDRPSHYTGIYISGGSMAAPVVGRMLEDILPMSLGIMPQLSETDLAIMNMHVPRIAGWSVEDAIIVLEGQGFNYTVVGEGSAVVGQLPVRNALVVSGTTIMLFTESEPPSYQVEMPNLIGMSYQEAKQVLEQRGLFIRTGGAPRTDGNALVSVQSIPQDQEVLYGSVIEVTLINSQIIERRID
ncbi:MAG: penicillin-binding transpeptidase domain-containing protein [Oscillospiraceae bacterium]|nr:penicillin-binding transpeptidase domain-containing protein [Oscillospiraceae bacterium]